MKKHKMFNTNKGDRMRISLIKAKTDKESFRIFQGLGFRVVEMEDLDNTDKQIENLVKENYQTIILTNEIAGFSEDIIKKYTHNDDINIIIAPSKRKFT